MTSSAPGPNRSPTLERIEQIVRGLLANDDIVLTPESRAPDVPGWDSLANINIVFAIEEEFQIRFSDEDLASADNVGALAERVERLSAP